MQLIDKEVERLEKQGLVRPSFSSWSSRTVLVPRKSGNPSLCIDYRPLNSITQKDKYPIPNVQLCIQTLNESKYFTPLDMNQAFHQIGLDEESIPKTAFLTPSGRFYEYLVVPYGVILVRVFREQ